MTLRQKTLLLMSAMIGGLLLIVYVTLRLAAVNSYLDLEAQDLRQHLERAQAALFEQLEALDTITHDWAAWNDTYQFIHDANPAYIASNLVDETFETGKTNLWLFINAAGQMVFGKAFDLEQQRAAPLPPDLPSHVTPGALLLRHTDVESRIAGILLLSDGPLLIAARPIITSDFQ